MDANELNKTVSEFENAVNKVKSLKDIYEKTDESNKKLNEISTELYALIDKHQEAQAKVSSQIEEISADVEKKYQEFNTIFKRFNDEFDQEVRRLSENQREYQLQLNSKIDRIESDIEVEIRNGNRQIETKLDNNSEKMVARIQELEDNLKSQGKKQFILTIVLLGLAIISIVIPFAIQ